MTGQGFWATLPRPIVGLAPMDGVTDAAARLIAARHGRPDVVMTEFVSVDALRLGAVALLDDFVYSDEERPVVAQIYGREPEAFREGAAIVCALGFDGIDVNMGCPAHSVARRGAGAALIGTPCLAREIIAAARAGVADWAEGKPLDSLVSHPRVRRIVRERAEPLGDRTRRFIPVSVKTRIGVDAIEVERWAEDLAQARPAAVTLHGRTLKQMYSGSADWGAIGRGASILRSAGCLVLGNGDLRGRNDAAEQVRARELDGALIGRAAIGNPWVFGERAPGIADRLTAALAHVDLVERLFDRRRHQALKRHLHGYCRGFDGAPALRSDLMFGSDCATFRQLIEQAAKAVAV